MNRVTFKNDVAKGHIILEQTEADYTLESLLRKWRRCWIRRQLTDLRGEGGPLQYLSE